MLRKDFVFLVLGAVCQVSLSHDFSFHICEPISIEMCRGIGYNETSMSNLVGHEMQTEVELILQTFTPLIEYVCSTQLKMFLCAAYVPMCTTKVSFPIGPCRNLCQNVRERCLPVLEGFGYLWPPALDCNHFPKENNHETMCMEGPGESPVENNADLSKLRLVPTGPQLECPGVSKSHLYVKLHRSGRCAFRCEADVLFSPHNKHLAEVWVGTWSYASIVLAIVATLSMVLGDDSRRTTKWLRVLTPLVWCHDMVTIGWTLRFFLGRNATSCGYDPQLPNVSLLLVDGLLNAFCASTFILRYYFGMAACAWWAILCLGWNRDVRRSNPEPCEHIPLGYVCTNAQSTKRTVISHRERNHLESGDITQNNFARFVGWGFPAFQSAAVIIARLVDADELLGVCFVGNQSDRGLQIFVATPLFCYWIFGSMNLISGYLVQRRSKKIIKGILTQQIQQQMLPTNSGIGTFLFIYCTPFTILLISVIYEFVNIDVWLNVPIYLAASTPLWPFLTRAFMELMLGILCSAWVLGPKISTQLKKQLPKLTKKQSFPTSHLVNYEHENLNIRQITSLPSQADVSITLNQISRYSSAQNKCAPQLNGNRSDYKMSKTMQRYGNETIL